MKSIRIIAAAAVLVIATAIVDVASAQDPSLEPQDLGSGSMMGVWSPRGMMGYGFGPSMMGYGGMRPGTMGWGASGPGVCKAMISHIDGRPAFAKAELKITATREPLWDAYADAARDNANTMLAHCTGMMSKQARRVVDGKPAGSA